MSMFLSDLNPGCPKCEREKREILDREWLLNPSLMPVLTPVSIKDAENIYKEIDSVLPVGGLTKL